MKAAVEVPGQPAVPALTFDERVGRTVADASHPNPDHRAYAARALAGADAEVLSHPAVVETLELLVADPVESVRLAASWWLHPAARRPA